MLLFDLLADAEMGVGSSPVALRELEDHDSAAKHRSKQDPNEANIVAACQIVRDIITGIKRCPYCNRDVASAPALDGCRTWNTHTSPG
jgi:hypothetical protein